MSDDAQILANRLITQSIIDFDDLFVKSATELRRLDALVKEQAQEIERLRAQRVPLTEESIQELTGENARPAASLADRAWCRGVRFGVRAAELHYGIPGAHGWGEASRPDAAGCCNQTVSKRCDGCPYAIEAAHGIKEN